MQPDTNEAIRHLQDAIKSCLRTYYPYISTHNGDQLVGR